MTVSKMDVKGLYEKRLFPGRAKIEFFVDLCRSRWKTFFNDIITSVFYVVFLKKILWELQINYSS
jgi:hypothetical protein